MNAPEIAKRVRDFYARLYSLTENAEKYSLSLKVYHQWLKACSTLDAVSKLTAAKK